MEGTTLVEEVEGLMQCLDSACSVLKLTWGCCHKTRAPEPGLCNLSLPSLGSLFHLLIHLSWCPGVGKWDLRQKSMFLSEFSTG